VRIGQLARALMDGNIDHVLIEFDPNGSLATTHESQGSDMGLFGGLLGWSADDDRLVHSALALRDAGIEVEVRIVAYGASHPNTYKLTLSSSAERHEMTALSTGGGMIEVIAIDGAEVSMDGGCHETLLYAKDGINHAKEFITEQDGASVVHVHEQGDESLIEIQSPRPLDASYYASLQNNLDIKAVKQLPRVLPVQSFGNSQVPFLTCNEMLRYNADRDLPLWELAVHYESARADLSHEEVIEKMCAIIRIMRKSIEQGIAGTEYADRILGCQTKNYQAKMESGTLLGGEMVNRMLLNVTAIMEVKSSMGVIVAAPTAGACAALPGACIGVADVLGASEEDAAKAMLAAAMVGVFIAAHATFAAEIGGCQAEGGSASGMAAAALVTLAGGTTHQAVGAASMALQNCMGMVCDPVANRVEVPCLGRNLIASMNAVSSANVALSDFDCVIPLDEVIETMDRVGRAMPCELRCTALGGLSITKTSKEIEERLALQKS
jgi:L-serine dehydratase